MAARPSRTPSGQSGADVRAPGLLGRERHRGGPRSDVGRRGHPVREGCGQPPAQTGDGPSENRGDGEEPEPAAPTGGRRGYDLTETRRHGSLRSRSVAG